MAVTFVSVSVQTYSNPLVDTRRHRDLPLGGGSIPYQLVIQLIRRESETSRHSGTLIKLGAEARFDAGLVGIDDAGIEDIKTALVGNFHAVGRRVPFK